MSESNEDFFDRVLLKLNRQYGKDELVLSLKKEIKEKDIEIGGLKSEIDFLTNELKSQEHKNQLEKEINKTALVEAKKEILYQQLLDGSKKNQKTISQLRKEKEHLIIKLAKLQ